MVYVSPLIYGHISIFSNSPQIPLKILNTYCLYVCGALANAKQLAKINWFIVAWFELQNFALIILRHLFFCERVHRFSISDSTFALFMQLSLFVIAEHLHNIFVYSVPLFNLGSVTLHWQHGLHLFIPFRYTFVYCICVCISMNVQCMRYVKA